MSGAQGMDVERMRRKMNQTPAALLVLASTVLAYSATVRAYDPAGVILGLAGLAIGVWGVISLIGASVRAPAAIYDAAMRPDLFGMFDPRRVARPNYATPVGTPVAPMAKVEPPELQLTPEVKAQLSMASHLEGRERSQIVEEALRSYLARLDRTKAA